MTFQEVLQYLFPYFHGIRKLKSYVSVELIFPKTWEFPNEILQKAQVEQNEKYTGEGYFLIFVSQLTDDFNHMVEAFRRDLKQYHSQLNNITDAPWFCGDTTWYWKENFPHSYEAIYGNYQNNVLANIIFVDFQQQGERGLTNAPDEDPDDLSTGYYGSAYRSPENWTTALRSSHFSTAARRGIISDRFVEAILQFWRER